MREREEGRVRGSDELGRMRGREAERKQTRAPELRYLISRDF